MSTTDDLPPWLVRVGETPTIVARIWATVDLERALAVAGVAGAPLPDDPHLGAAVRLARPADEVPVAFVEPSTEGPLAERLARHDEGPAGRYVAVPDGLVAAVARALAAGVPLSREATGPFGPSVLVRDASRTGSFLLIVEGRAGTIER